MSRDGFTCEVCGELAEHGDGICYTCKQLEYKIIPNGLVNNYMVKDKQGKILITGLTLAGAKEYVERNICRNRLGCAASLKSYD